MRRPRTALSAAALVLGLALAGCGGSSGGDAPTADLSPGLTGSDLSSWDAVLAAAKGQTVNWYMYGGDDTLNGFVNGRVATELKKYDVTLNQVKITDTVDAVNKALGEKQAGRADGSVDAIWINGENFATGKQADLWYCGWDKVLPNSQYVDFTNPAVANDFGTPVEGCEGVWQQASSALVYDSAKLSTADVASVDSLFAWSAAHKGQFTYPAPPDFTGSMAVRTFLYDTAGTAASALQGAFDEAAYASVATKTWARLGALEPSLWRGGKTYPTGQSDVEKLYADGEVAAFLTYGPGAVGDQVAKGVYPATTREAVLSVGNISNYNFLSIPDNAAHKAAAMVLVNVLQDPSVQLELYTRTGTFPGVDLATAPADVQSAFAAVPRNPAVLTLAELTAHSLPELQSAYVNRIEKDWKAEVLQK